MSLQAPIMLVLCSMLSHTRHNRHMPTGLPEISETGLNWQYLWEWEGGFPSLLAERHIISKDSQFCFLSKAA